MINLNKNTEAISQSQRDQNIAKEMYSQRNRNIITRFGIKSLRITLVSNHAHRGRTDVEGKENKKLSYWVKNQRKIYRQFLQGEHTPMTPERKSALENIGFVLSV